MKNIISFIVFTAFLITQTTAAKAEYVIFKVTKENTLASLNPNEFKKVYEIVTRYKWPSNVNTFYQNQSAYPIDYSTSYAEESYIRAQLKQVNNDFDIAFIPDVIYEAAFLGPDVILLPATMVEGAQGVQAEMLEIEQYKPHSLESKAIAIVSDPSLSDDQAYLKVLEYMYNRNLHSTALEIANKINNKIVDLLNKDLEIIKKLKLYSPTEAEQSAQVPEKEKSKKKKKGIRKIFGKAKKKFKGLKRKKSAPTVEEDNIKNYISAAISEYFKLFGEPRASWNALLNRQTLVFKNVIDKIIRLEYEARETNDVYIFRGSEGKDSPLRMDKDTYKDFSNPTDNTREQILLNKSKDLPEKSTKPYSISYGFSMMAGMAIESGGNVFRFMVSYMGAYGLRISKKAFFDKERPYMRNMFFVPPFGSVFSFYATDDLFHPRTKVGLGQGVSAANSQIDQLQLGKEAGRLPWVVGVTKTKKWKELAADIANYISTHANLLYSHDISNKMRADGGNYVIPDKSSVTGDEILSTYHSDLLFFKEHKEGMKGALGDIKKSEIASKRERKSEVSESSRRSALPQVPTEVKPKAVNPRQIKPGQRKLRPYQRSLPPRKVQELMSGQRKLPARLRNRPLPSPPPKPQS